jgi:hypothetical protein
MAPWKSNYELVLTAKIRAAPVPTVLHSPHPIPERKAKVNPPLVEIHHKHTHHMPNNSLL